MRAKYLVLLRGQHQRRDHIYDGYGVAGRRVRGLD